MKHLLNTKDFDLLSENYKDLRPDSQTIQKFLEIIKVKPYESDEVDDFLEKLDVQAIKNFENYYTKTGVLSIQSLKVLTRYFKVLLNEQFLKDVKNATENSFQNMEDFLDKPELFQPGVESRMKKILERKPEILRRLDQIMKRISRYKDF